MPVFRWTFSKCFSLDPTHELFFDDEHRNFEVEALGVTMQLVPSSGTDRRLYEAGLKLWRKRRGIKVEG
jgi:magnesium-dependent phosphatase 1